MEFQNCIYCYLEASNFFIKSNTILVSYQEKNRNIVTNLNKKIYLKSRRKTVNTVYNNVFKSKDSIYGN